MSLRFSGRTRVWAVVTIVVWVAGLSWTTVKTGLPPLSATAHQACDWYGFGTSPNPDVIDKYRSRCLAYPAVQAQARSRYFSDRWQLFAILAALWGVLAMCAGFVAVFISWVRQKFSHRAAR